MSLDPARLLQEVRLAQKAQSDIAAHSARAEAVKGTATIDDFVDGLASAWKDGEARPTRQKQPAVKHGRTTRVDPFADVWPVVGGGLLAEPAVSAKVLMERLAKVPPDLA